MKSLFNIFILLFFITVSFGQEITDSTVMNDNDTTVYITPYRMAEFKGGMSNFYKYLGDSIKFKNCPRDEIQSTYYISFIVEKDGSISNVKSLMVVDIENNKHLEGIFSNMPNWNPAEDENGKFIRCRIRTPIKIHPK